MQVSGFCFCGCEKEKNSLLPVSASILLPGKLDFIDV